MDTQRMMRRWALLLLFVLLFVACTPPAPATNAPAAGGAASGGEAAAASDLLADITQRGVLRIATDPAYPPQSELVEAEAIPGNSKCTGEEHSANQFKGFDIDVAVEIAKRLGVEPCFVTPDWTLIIGGNWAGRWDLSVGSMSITPERMKALYFTQPYYSTPANFFVHQDNTTFTKVEDLAGKRIGFCTGCTYDSYLAGTLEIPGVTINFEVKDAQMQGYDTDTAALQDLALGDGVRLDAVLTALHTGLTFISDGNSLKQLGDSIYYEYNAAAVDRSSSLDAKALHAKVTEIIQAMHQDGTLKKLSDQYYGVDLSAAAGSFDLTKLGQ